MTWLTRHRARRYLKSSLFLAPAASIVLALVVAPVVRWIDDRTRWTLLDFGSSGAAAVVSGLSSSLLGLIVFAFSILLLAIQIAGGQLSPRIIARIFRAPFLRFVLSFFVFSYAYSLAALSRIGERVPQLPVAIAIFASLASLGIFIYLVQRIGEAFRPGTVMTTVAAETRIVLDAMYPAPFTPEGGDHATLSLDTGRPDRVIVQRKASGVVLAFDAEGLTALASTAGCVVELVPQVGDFLAVGEPLFRLYGPGAAAVDEAVLRDSVALGIERTMEQDPAFGFRIIVDIASKALSPAINDPTTGVLAVDQLHHLLSMVSRRQLDTGVVRDASGAVRLVYRTPDWEDFVTLAATELRVYGATNPQVTRRLRAMYDQLLRVVPAERAEALRREVALLEATVEGAWANPPDRAIAGASDLQGFGSRSRAR
ncbi:MAG: DUF2254 domain-containing protein [Holophagales bacterium]|nr:DUF2254 domain-containing protein [Holophagales bacterium]